jgi:hypothetical protein
MEIDEFLKYRDTLLTESLDEDGFISEDSLLQAVLPLMLDAKLIDSEDYNDSYFIFKEEKIKINGYSVNESGERLQLFIVNEESIANTQDDLLKISQKSYYESNFNRVVRFLQNATRGEFHDDLQDADGIKALINHLSSDEGIDQYDVLEIFLISATATVETRGAAPQPKQINFDKEKIKVTFRRNRERITKELVIVKKLIDLNFLYSVLVSQGNREALVVDFESLFGEKLEAIKAADEKFFESYLCVLPGNIISDLYREFSSRLLEKNVRSFLQFPKKGVNSGIRDTIRWAPEKFIAYNNGLTITATGKEIIEENGRCFIKSLSDFQIVNGGQTTATIYFSQKENIPVDGIKVMAKINIVKDATETELDELISNISTYSNAQSRVSKVDLKARSLPMVKLKALSDSVVTPKGIKWFFERAKGELNTMIRKSGRKEGILKKYPKERRFTKEELAKYYSAWGNVPFKVKKGGEKIFREFIEEITGETKVKPPQINRTFYENVISRILLFRGMEKIYADNKIGNLRAAVIPYSISVLYSITDGSEKDVFDLSKIWLSEGLEQDLADYLLDLMKLMNELIKKYATSDDPSENSKTRELWERVFESTEVQHFIKSADTKKILKKYTLSLAQYKQLNSRSSKATVDFHSLLDNVSIHANGHAFYQELLKQFSKFTHSYKEHLNQIIDTVYKHKDLKQELIDNENLIIKQVMIESPEIFDRIEVSSNQMLHHTLDFIIEHYNTAVSNDQSIRAKFRLIGEKAKEQNIKGSSIWDSIGEKLENGEAPKIADLYTSASLFLKETEAQEIKQLQIINEAFILKMVEWDSKRKVLSANERQYLAEFAYGFKKLNSFHENHIRRHLQTIIEAGFK